MAAQARRRRCLYETRAPKGPTVAKMIDRLKTGACALVLACAGWSAPPALAQSTTAGEPFVVEYTYKVEWGHLDEFISLFKKNHYPVLQRLKQLGYVRDIGVAYPVNHAGEADRWDMRVTVTFRDANASLPDPAVDKAIIAELYPDKKTFEREEQRRFELLIEHTDVPVFLEDMKDWDAPAPEA